MYRLGHQIKHHHWPYILGGLIIIGCIVAGIVTAPRFFKANTTLTQSSSVTHHISAADTTTQHIAKATFAFDIPSGWRSVAPPAVQPVAQSWAGTAPDGSGRRLDVYIDHIPGTLAVNRLLPVQPTGSRLNTAGMVSDNCTNFTDKATESAATGTAAAKWDGINFICDMANYERDVVAIGSTAGINDVALVGSTGTHPVLLVYTDNSISPDYSVFTAIVQSFTVL